MSDRFERHLAERLAKNNMSYRMAHVDGRVKDIDHRVAMVSAMLGAATAAYAGGGAHLLGRLLSSAYCGGRMEGSCFVTISGASLLASYARPSRLLCSHIKLANCWD